MKQDNKSFQYAVTVALNPEETIKDLERITKINPYIDEDNWEGINYPSEKGRTIALNVLYAKKEKNTSCLCFKAELKS